MECRRESPSQSYDQSKDDYQFNKNVPTAQGSNDDFTSVSMGATYKTAHWTWWNRLETRQADSEDKYGLSTNLVGEPQDGVAVSVKAMRYITNSSKGSKRGEQEVRLGMAYRPHKSRWIILDHLDIYFDRLEDDFADGYNNWRNINHLHANYRLSPKWQTSFYYGLKYLRDNIAATRYANFTDMLSIETRYNLNKRWDIGVHGSILHSWHSNTLEYSAGADVGYSSINNSWVSLGYNLIGFEDEDFDAAHYTAQGAYMRFRMKFDQQSVKEAANWMNR